MKETLNLIAWILEGVARAFVYFAIFFVKTSAAVTIGALLLAAIPVLALAAALGLFGAGLVVLVMLIRS